MSRIDLARLPTRSPDRFSLVDGYRGAPQAGGVDRPSPSGPMLQGRPRDRRDREDAIPSANAIPAADLEGIAGLAGDTLVGELSRIDILLKNRLAGTADAGLRQAIEAGRELIGENVRRLRLVQRGNDALVLSR